MSRLLVLAGLIMVLAGCGDQATITGSATYRERIALPPEAVLEVVLEDVSLADAAAVQLGRFVVENPGSPPFAFEVPYGAGAIDSRHRYALRARITVGEDLLFTTDQHYGVLSDGHADQTELLLVKVGRGAGVTMRGMFQYQADAALFTDCDSRRRLPVAMEAEYPALERAYLEARPEPGAEVLVTIEGRLAERPGMEGGTREFVLVDRFLGIWPGETCGNAGMTEALENTYWKLTRLGNAPVKVFGDQREPHLVLRADNAQVAGSAGCNQFHGGFELAGDALSFSPLAVTMMACPEGMEQEQAILVALGRVTAWRIDGQHLELLAADGVVVVRGEASPKQ